MTVLTGADSATPQSSLYRGYEIWGVYVAGATPHVWTRAEVVELGKWGVKAVVPIVVPPSGHWWSEDDTAGYIVLEELARTAKTWGVIGPLCLDIEEGPAEAMGVQREKVVSAWVIACKTHGFEPWTYGGATWHADTIGKAKRWLAHWSWPSGNSGDAPKEIPAGFDALQYAGNVGGGRIDLDLFAPGSYLGTDFKLVELPPKEKPPMSDPTTEPTATSILTNPEIDKVLSAIDAQVSTVRGAASDSNLAAAQATAALLTTHVAELNTLLGGTSVAVATTTTEPMATPQPEEPVVDPAVADAQAAVTAAETALADAQATLAALEPPK